ncbi:Tn3 family transposase, partial [Pseudomonas aeruginosa]|uniref:Tn3 family transposase n=1 Tax=Pseudomonas aeruginosa TaxID=287 RepID=UPI00389243D6
WVSKSAWNHCPSVRGMGVQVRVESPVILQNTVDMMRILQKLAREGWQFTDEDVSFLSPYLTSNVKRFGEFNLKLNRPPEPWIKDSVFQQAAGSLRVNSTSKAAAEEAI